MKILKSITPSRIAKGMIACVGLLLGSATLSEAREVSVYLTSQRLGHKKAIYVTSADRKMDPATAYTYELSGKVRGQNGKPISMLLKEPTDIATFLDAIAPKDSSGSALLSGTVQNEKGTLPFKVIEKKFVGSRKMAGVGKVSFSFLMVAEILEDGQCVVRFTDVYIKCKKKPKMKLGDIIFTRGFTLSIATVEE